VKQFANRGDAGCQLAELFSRFPRVRNPIILALPRGGVPVAAEIAKALGRPFDVLIVRKLGVPGNEEYAMGAIAGGGVRVISENVVKALGVSPAQLEQVIFRETGELARREKLYRAGRAAPAIAGSTVIVVDDGIATGATMSAAVDLLRYQEAGRIIVAVPVAPRETVARLTGVADEVVCVHELEPCASVGQWYEDFTQTTDEQVLALLAEAAHADHEW
jgi:putative phosphoribosyl transferase